MTAAATCAPPSDRPGSKPRPGPGSKPALELVEAHRADDELSVDELGARIVGLAGRLAAATCRWLLLVAAFDAREGFARFGLPTTARWLSHTCGVSQRTAIEHVRVARALATFPALAAEMSSGRLSYSHIRAISRLARDAADAAAVTELVDVARTGTISQLESVVRGLRTVDDAKREGTPRPEPYLTHTWTPQSQWRATARLEPERGALVQSVLETIARDESITLADALVRMAEIALVAVSDRDQPPRPLRGDERAAVVVHLEASQLPAEQFDHSDRAAAGAEPRSHEREPGTRPQPAGRIADGPGLPLPVVLWLCCSGRIGTVVRGAAARPGGPRSVLDLGRTHRVVTARLFRALLLRDGGCTHPGCRSRAGPEAHHVQHWVWGGNTDLDNLVLLCARHHHAHHEGEFSIAIVGPGEFRFLRAGGRELEQVVDPTRLTDGHGPIEDSYTEVAADAARGAWRGERLDRDWAVAVLAQSRRSVTSTARRGRPARWDGPDPWSRTA